MLLSKHQPNNCSFSKKKAMNLNIAYNFSFMEDISFKYVVHTCTTVIAGLKLWSYNCTRIIIAPFAHTHTPLSTPSNVSINVWRNNTRFGLISPSLKQLWFEWIVGVQSKKTTCIRFQCLFVSVFPPQIGVCLHLPLFKQPIIKYIQMNFFC